MPKKGKPLSRKMILEIPCNYCLARKNVSCKTSTGYAITHFHKPRLDKAKEHYGTQT